MPKKILVADDEQHMRTLYSRVLCGAKHDVTLVGSIREAAQCIEANDYDLLITDLMFPDGLGTELISAFHKKNPGRKTMLITGSVANCRELDCEGLYKYIQKPFDLDMLVEAVAVALT